MILKTSQEIPRFANSKKSHLYAYIQGDIRKYFLSRVLITVPLPEDRFLKLLHIIRIRPDAYLTDRNSCYCNLLLATCVLIRRVEKLYRWSNRETMFCNHGFKISEIFWEGMDWFVEENQHFVTNPSKYRSLESELRKMKTLSRIRPIALETALVLDTVRPGRNCSNRSRWFGNSCKNVTSGLMRLRFRIWFPLMELCFTGMEQLGGRGTTGGYTLLRIG